MFADERVTIFGAEETNGLGALVFRHPDGTFALSPASHVALSAIFDNHGLLRGDGIDWGCGSGCLAIAAARAAAVESVIAIDINPLNIAAARENAVENEVARKLVASVGDSYRAFDRDGIAAMNRAKGTADFIVSNPPASDGDDGFGFRRVVARGALEYLKRDGLLLLNISSQYGETRIAEIERCAPGLEYERVLASSGLVPFDLRRGDLYDCLLDYAATEARGEPRYEFVAPDRATPLTATQALEEYRATAASPLSRWEMHLFRRTAHA